MTSQAQDYPFAQEFITDTEGHIRKVIIDFADYQKLLEFLEDEGLYRAVKELQNETSLSLDEAMAEIDRP